MVLAWANWLSNGPSMRTLWLGVHQNYFKELSGKSIVEIWDDGCFPMFLIYIKPINAGISQGTKTTLAFMADVIKQDFGWDHTIKARITCQARHPSSSPRQFFEGIVQNYVGPTAQSPSLSSFFGTNFEPTECKLMPIIMPNIWPFRCWMSALSPRLPQYARGWVQDIRNALFESW